MINHGLWSISDLNSLARANADWFDNELPLWHGVSSKTPKRSLTLSRFRCKTKCCAVYSSSLLRDLRLEISTSARNPAFFVGTAARPRSLASSAGSLGRGGAGSRSCRHFGLLGQGLPLGLVLTAHLLTPWWLMPLRCYDTCEASLQLPAKPPLCILCLLLCRWLLIRKARLLFLRKTLKIHRKKEAARQSS